MITITFPGYEEMCQKVASEIQEDLNRNPRQMLCIAAGSTSLGVFRYLIEAYNQGNIDFKDAYFVSMDEWLHMNENTKDSCGCFLVENFLNHVNYKKDHVRLWDGCCQDTSKECADVEAFITAHSTQNSIDFLVLGMGMNGHLALNEPGADLHGTAHVCVLDPITQTVGQKYFSTQTPLTGGITLGIEDFRKAGRTVLMVNGTQKADITARVLHSPDITVQLPATAVREFTDASFYCDEAAAAKL